MKTHLQPWICAFGFVEFEEPRNCGVFQSHVHGHILDTYAFMIGLINAEAILQKTYAQTFNPVGIGIYPSPVLRMNPEYIQP